MNSPDTIQLRLASWRHDEAALRKVREAVFVVEQGVPLEIEIDGLDADCTHAIALTGDGAPVGVARMQANGHLGRIAVMAPHRGRGIGGRLVAFLLEQAEARGLSEVDLNAQCHATVFYQRLGFQAIGDTFMEAGIPHIRMIRSLDDSAKVD